jgi:2-polyprenyl-6-methoxyphenol hydroxylase-like FAD-dependent oxidoreductase
MHPPTLQVFERLPEPPAPDDMSVWGNFEQASERLYMIGLNGRGQAVLRDLGVMDRIDQASSLVLGRMDWQPGTAPDSPKLTYYGATRTYKTRCIQRDRLASCLLQELREKYSSVVSLQFGARCVHADWTKAIPEDDIPEVSHGGGCSANMHGCGQQRQYGFGSKWHVQGGAPNIL